jgi:thioredoxin reductase (NADPH)
MKDHKIDPNEFDVAVVGAGPIGIELAIALQTAGVRYTLFEANQIGHAISQWPPHTRFYSTPEHVALAGVPVHTVDQQAITGEEYLAYLRALVEQFDLNLHVYERVTAVQQAADGFTLYTRTLKGEGRYRCRAVVLTTGGMAGPRLLGIPGEDLPHVRHYFPNPHIYFRTRLLVVGGKNSALESALRSWRAGAQVTLSYWRPDFDYNVVKPHLAADIKTRLENGEITFLPATVPVEITPHHVALAATDQNGAPNGRPILHETDFVLLATGFVADMSLFAQAGIALRGAAQVPVYNPETMETNVPGLYVAGTAVGGTQRKFEYFISTSHHHVDKIVRALTGRPAERLGTVGARRHAVTWEEVKAN